MTSVDFQFFVVGQPSPPITSSSDCDTPTTSASATFTTVLPNAIYLPVAHHDGPSSCVQVVGYPQIVIPVAIARSNSSVSRPTLYVDPVLTQGIQMASSLQIGDEIGYVHLLTSMIPSTSNDYSNFESVPSAQKVRQERSSLKRTSQASNDAKPLDLSLHIKEKRVADGSRDETPLKSGEPEAKRFPCECGVVFSSEVTLAGHRKYYCNNGTTHENAFREPQRRTPSRCHQCDFQPASASQLSQHMRTNHSVVQAYVCKLCGYKGYSQRGIKSHLRTHDDASSVESLMNNQVYAITAHSRPVQCSQCSKSFATRNLQRRHHCGDRPKSDLS
ncbi:hypothetical protein AB6A40_002544 [Gnathostoma spinigerum]|uniref:C2H2-type domain-containing protein n=1 Tax=Gnathostoma spinigerum TaxID=75299 RepID=A0ABD6E824_9BILA